MTVGFVVWNPFQVYHMRPIAEYLDDSMFVVIQRHGRPPVRADFGGSVSSFIDHPHQIVSPGGVRDLDGTLDAFVCPNPFPGMNALVSSRRIGIQYSMTKESYQYGSWRSQFDLNLTYGEYTARKLLKYGPVVPVGNPRFTPWFRGESVAADLAHSTGAQSDRPTILYLPTWGEFSSVPRFLPAIEALQDKYEVIAKLHHKSYLNDPDATEQLASSTLDRSLSPKDDLLPLLHQADIIISDYSGAIFDAIYVRKPVVLLQDNPNDLIGDKFTFDSIEYARRDEIGPVVSSPNQLRSAVVGILDGSIDYRSQNKALREECFSEDVRSAERCAEVLNSLASDRRNPTAPLIKGTQANVTPKHPVEDRINRLEQKLERATENSNWTSRVQIRSLRARMRDTATAIALKLGIPGLIRRLVAAFQLVPTRFRPRLEGWVLRLLPHTGVTLSILEGRRKQGRLSTVGHLWLADRYRHYGQLDEAVALLTDLLDDDELDSDVLQLLVKAYSSEPGPNANWTSLIGLQSPRVGLAVANKQLVSPSPELPKELLSLLVNTAVSMSAQCNFDLAAELYRAAIEIDDDLPYLHSRLANTLEQAFRFDEARDARVEALRRQPLHKEDNSALSRLYSKQEEWSEARDASLAGVPELSIDVSRQFPVGRRVLRDLDILDRAFDDPSVVGTPEYQEALARSRPMAGARPAEYWTALHWRLIRAGCFSVAYRIKDLVAANIIDDLSYSKRNDVRSTLVLSRALVTLRQVEEARHLLQLRLDTESGALAQLILEKGLADVSFFEGDIEPIASWYTDRTGDQFFDQKEALEIARSMFYEQRIAIVGPGVSPDDPEQERTSTESLRRTHDVIVKTNLTSAASTRGGQPVADVVYYNSGITRLGLDGLLYLSRDQGVQQVVLRRPHALNSLTPHRESGFARLIEAEPGFHLYASSFGVPRIIYDIAFHRPASIDVMNIDFFTGETEYVEGYKVENADVSFRGFSHDFRNDFELSQNLSRSGAVGFDKLATSLLSMSGEEYLSVLDTKLSAE